MTFYCNNNLMLTRNKKYVKICTINEGGFGVSNIITYTDKNINVGKLVVNDRDSLNEIRDTLLLASGYNSYGIHRVHFQEGLWSNSSVLHEGFLRRDDSLIQQYVTDVVDEDCEYTKKVFECKCLNLIRLFNSLLGEINADNYKSKIVKEFIRLGIVDVSSFEKNWKLYFRNIIDSVFREIEVRNISNLDELRGHELKFFRFLLEEKILSYDIEDCICFKSYQGKPFLTGYMSDLEEMEINNALLLGDDTIFNKHMRCLKK